AVNDLVRFDTAQARDHADAAVVTLGERVIQATLGKALQCFHVKPSLSNRGLTLAVRGRGRTGPELQQLPFTLLILQPVLLNELDELLRRSRQFAALAVDDPQRPNQRRRRQRNRHERAPANLVAERRLRQDRNPLAELDRPL